LRPWKLIAYFAFNDEKVAFRFEKYMKTGSGREFIKKHVKWNSNEVIRLRNNGGLCPPK
jgi:hypothetical protein